MHPQMALFGLASAACVGVGGIEVTYLEQERYVDAAVYTVCGVLEDERVEADGFGRFSAEAGGCFQQGLCGACGRAAQGSALLEDRIEFTGSGSASFGPPVGTSSGIGDSYLRVVFELDRPARYEVNGVGRGIAEYTNTLDLIGDGVAVSLNLDHQIDESGVLQAGTYELEIRVGSDLDVPGSFDGLITFSEPGCNAADLRAPFGENGPEDVSGFVNAFFAGTPSADLSGDGLLDLRDIVRFVGAYRGGCP